MNFVVEGPLEMLPFKSFNTVGTSEIEKAE